MANPNRCLPNNLFIEVRHGAGYESDAAEEEEEG